MKIGQIVRFHNERFFEGAVQLSWMQRREAQARQAAEAFVFHGPRYHGAGGAEREGFEGAYKLKDTASFLNDLLQSMADGLHGHERNPYSLVVAGYGSGKSHLALTCATLLSEPTGDSSRRILEQVSHADPEIGDSVAAHINGMNKPALVLPLDGMSGFHLGNALSRAVFEEFRRHGVNAGAIRDLSPRFQTAEQFVERNFSVRVEAFGKSLSGMELEQICERLRENDEVTYTAVDAIYAEANGHPIPIEGQESAQELLETLCTVYCNSEGPFSQVIILFDELGRYLEYASQKPQLAGDFALQQIFQGVQDNSNKVRFIGFIQYELKAYLKRFSGTDLRQLQRYVTRFDTAEKWYLSSNLETIFAHMIGKNEEVLERVWQETAAKSRMEQTWQLLSKCLPGFERYPVWIDQEHFSRVIALGCWPLHPFTVWFLTRQRDLVQSRSALTFIKDLIDGIIDDEAVISGSLRQISAAELVVGTMLPELISAERESGGATAETLQMLLEKYSGHLSPEQASVLAGVAVIEKVRVGKQSREFASALLQEATCIDASDLPDLMDSLSELGAAEWNDELGQYELLSDGATRGQFQNWLRSKQAKLNADGVRDLFVRRGATDIELTDISTDFSHSKDISTQDWFFEAQLSHSNIVENTIKTAFQEWQQASLPKDAKGRIIYLYMHPDDDPVALGDRVQEALKKSLKTTGQSKAPIWVVGVSDRQGTLAEHLSRLYLFDEQLLASDQERFRRFIPDERERSRLAVKNVVQEAIKQRDYWIAGFSEAPPGRLRAIGLYIFKEIYPDTIPFPFDGFGSAAGGGAVDAVTLTRGLIARQVDGPWVQSQPKRLQNRVNTVLVQSWKTLQSTGKLTNPSATAVKSVFQYLESSHRDDPKRTLLASYRELLGPPYGLNASSAGLLLGLLLGLDNPPRRIESSGQLIASGDWLQKAFPSQRGRHHFDESVLAVSCLKFLAEDAEDRWRGILSRWEAEQNFGVMARLAQEAEKMCLVDPLPETLEGNYNYLRDRSKEAVEHLGSVQRKIINWEKGIDKAERHSACDHAIRIGSEILRQRNDMASNPRWPDDLVTECDNLLPLTNGIIVENIAKWIPRQSCQTAVQVPDFRKRVERQVKSLDELGFRSESNALSKQSQQSIHKIERLQEFSLTLAQCGDYPRQPAPSVSTPVRSLRDELSFGGKLIEGVKSATGALTEVEIDAHIVAITQRQAILQECLDRHNEALGALYSVQPQSFDDIKNLLAKVNSLRDIFIGTRDEGEISELIIQLERIVSDVEGWSIENCSEERIQEILTQQIKIQTTSFKELLDNRDIDPVWDVELVYTKLMEEEVAIAHSRSETWVKARQLITKELATFDRQRCVQIFEELSSVPGYVSTKYTADINELKDAIDNRVQEFDEAERQVLVDDWQEPYLSLTDVEKLTRERVEDLLHGLRNPPCTVLPVERSRLSDTERRLTAQLDNMSLDELYERISQLSKSLQKKLFEKLAKLLGIAS